MVEGPTASQTYSFLEFSDKFPIFLILFFPIRSQKLDQVKVMKFSVLVNLVFLRTHSSIAMQVMDLQDIQISVQDFACDLMKLQLTEDVIVNIGRNENSNRPEVTFADVESPAAPTMGEVDV